MSSQLSQEYRKDSIKKVQSQELDILVIGGGIVGAGAALDAATRGLKTAVVEAQDWSSGTSSRSSKLIHGGLRYLEMLDFSLVKEALQERSILLQKIGPHLTRPIPFLYPLKHRIWERIYIGSGIMLYDTLGITSGNSRGVPMHKHYSKKGIQKIVPALKDNVFIGAIRYYDGQVDDARYNMEVIRTASHYGAHAISRTKVTNFIKENKKIIGAGVEDLESGQVFQIRAKQIINATGVWTNEMQDILSKSRSYNFKVRASKGVHLVVPKNKIKSEVGFILKTEKSVLFIIPWFNHWILGTTDTEYSFNKDHPAATLTDIKYILNHVNKILVTSIEHKDIQGVFVGLRPLLSSDTSTASSTAKLSREHIVANVEPGLVMVAGGKWTTYRIIAKEAVDKAVANLNLKKNLPSITHDVPLIGAQGLKAIINAKARIAEEYNLDQNQINHLINRYGSNIIKVLEYVNKNSELRKPIPGAENYISAEIAYAASHEGALHLEDVLTRRTRISIESWDRGIMASVPAANIMGQVLGWNENKIKQEISIYESRVKAERLSQEKIDDKSADEERLKAKIIFEKI